MLTELMRLAEYLFNDDTAEIWQMLFIIVVTVFILRVGQKMLDSFDDDDQDGFSI